MEHHKELLKSTLEYSIPWFVLLILLFYSYIDFFQHPFGFGWLPDGDVVRVFVNPTNAPNIMKGDRILQIGSLSWNEFHSDLRKTFFNGVKKGGITPVMVKRNGQVINIPWALPGPNRNEQVNELTSQWPVAYIFWLAGLLAFMFLRPKDERWWLFLAFSFLTAIWLMASSGLSNYHLWYSALVLRMAIWLSLPVYLHLHWVFPRPLGKLPKPLVIAGYGLALILMVAQWFQILQENLYILGFLVALSGSLILLVVHFFRQVEMRREVGLIAILGGLAFLPAIALGAAYASSAEVPLTSIIVLIGFATIPFAYLYVAFRRHLGGLELRVNRLVSAYLFIVLLGMVGLPLIAITDRQIASTDGTLIIGSLEGLSITMLYLWFFPRFQRFLEQKLLGISINPEQIHERYSAHTATSTSIKALVNLLTDILLPSLSVRQFSFLQFDNNSPKVLLAYGLAEEQFADEHFQSVLSTLKNNFSEGSQLLKFFPWAHLAFPLKVGEDMLGIWLFGGRDPDDYYSQRELPLLRSLANQTAIALSNIMQTERLHEAFQDRLVISEKERHHLALELHDGVLDKIAALTMYLNEQSITPEFQRAYRDLTDQIREIIHNLRPVMLNYGLLPAVEGYVNELNERLDGKVQVVMDIKSDETRYAPDLEQHLFRIVQEACTNALRHANPTQVTISGKLENDNIELLIQDDGSGFIPVENIEPHNKHSDYHFGLTGMLERAELVGAKISIDSASSHGTSIQIIWRSDKA